MSWFHTSTLRLKVKSRRVSSPEILGLNKSLEMEFSERLGSNAVESSAKFITIRPLPTLFSRPHDLMRFCDKKYTISDDLMTWKRFPHYRPCEGIHRWQMASLHKGSVMQRFGDLFVLAWVTCWTISGTAGVLRHHGAHAASLMFAWLCLEALCINGLSNSVQEMQGQWANRSFAWMWLILYIYYIIYIYISKSI